MYKEIILTYKGKLDKKDLTAVNVFNSFFKDDEIQLECDGDRVVILLKEIDFDVFKKSTVRCSHYVDKPIFQDIFAAVDKIKSYGIKGKKRIYVNYNKERKVKGRKQKEASRTQFYYASGHHFKEENNPLPAQYTDRIIAGDSENILGTLPDNCVDLIFTSPPYNFGLAYAQNQDARYWEDYFAKLFKIFTECIRVVKYGGRILVNVQPLFSDYIPSHHIISNFFINAHLIWKGEILWEKNNYNCKYTAWGSWKSPSNPYLKYTWEFIEIFCKGTLKHPGERDNIDISAEEFKKWVVAKWSIGPERRMQQYGHPAMFPEALVARALKLFSFQDDVVLDPFNGVGTTTVAAKRLGRRYLGIDISEHYCETADRRMEDLKDEMGLFANTA